MKNIFRIAFLSLAVFSLGISVAVASSLDSFQVTKLGAGKLKVQLEGRQALEFETNYQPDLQRPQERVVDVRIRESKTGRRASFRFSEADRRIDFGIDGSEHAVEIREDGTVEVGGVTCDGAGEEFDCIADAIADLLEDVPAEGAAAILATVADDLNSENMHYGDAVRVTLDGVVGRLAERSGGSSGLRGR